ncbi:hypothetical protein PHLCEN_2v5417 [Hermanssonia centrifuga]|uniref:Major facilitator superfamily (MFS) profile domain-containing protein n=1 Tax=Hermanssonia centrifuga TaxID=98765 RepID=A0A2R6P5B8_9APHY|nr:hypothetical protein PHLCEN_2v5417 [Hermanssonia centrifuga]
MPSITPGGMSTRGSKSTEDVISTEISDLEPDFPEGGLQAWLAVLGSFLVYFASFGVINSFGTFQEFYLREYLSNYNATVIAFIGALQITLLYIAGIFIGPLFDAIGLKVALLTLLSIENCAQRT